MKLIIILTITLLGLNFLVQTQAELEENVCKSITKKLKCRRNKDCKWLKRKNLCVDDEDDEEDEKLCSDFRSKRNCRKNNCDWFKGSCQDKAPTTKCSKATRKAKCLKIPGCSFLNSARPYKCFLTKEEPSKPDNSPTSSLPFLEQRLSGDTKLKQDCTNDFKSCVTEWEKPPKARTLVPGDESEWSHWGVMKTKDGDEYEKVSCGGAACCGLMKSGEARCWGNKVREEQVEGHTYVEFASSMKDLPLDCSGIPPVSWKAMHNLGSTMRDAWYYIKLSKKGTDFMLVELPCAGREGLYTEKTIEHMEFWDSNKGNIQKIKGSQSSPTDIEFNKRYFTNDKEVYVRFRGQKDLIVGVYADNFNVMTIYEQPKGSLWEGGHEGGLYEKETDLPWERPSGGNCEQYGSSYFDCMKPMSGCAALDTKKCNPNQIYTTKCAFNPIHAINQKNWDARGKCVTGGLNPNQFEFTKRNGQAFRMENKWTYCPRWMAIAGTEYTKEIEWEDISAGFLNGCGITKTSIAGGKGNDIVCWGRRPMEKVGTGITFTSISSGYSQSMDIVTFEEDGENKASVINYAWEEADTIGAVTNVKQAIMGPGCGDLMKDSERCYATTKQGNLRCYLFEDGKVDCFPKKYYNSDNGSEYSGNEGRVSRIPTSVQNKAEQIALGDSFACAIVKDSKDVVCWGGEDKDWWGDNINVLGRRTGPFTSITAGFFHVCGIKEDGKVECWGGNHGFQRHQATLTKYNDQGGFKQVSAGFASTCGVLKNNNQVVCLGELQQFYCEDEEREATCSAGREYQSHCKGLGPVEEYFSDPAN